jgi:hypothetical protein
MRGTSQGRPLGYFEKIEVLTSSVWGNNPKEFVWPFKTPAKSGLIKVLDTIAEPGKVFDFRSSVGKFWRKSWLILNGGIRVNAGISGAPIGRSRPSRYPSAPNAKAPNCRTGFVPLADITRGKKSSPLISPKAA